MTREMWVSSEVPEEPEITREREEAFIQELLNRTDGRCSPEMQEVLDGIDFIKLKAIFTEIASQHGIDESKLNFLEKDRIFGVEGNAFVGGSYAFHSNVIFLAEKFSPKRFDRLAIKNQRKNKIEKYGSENLFYLAGLIHEETHAVSKNECSNKVPNFDPASQLEFQDVQSGYHMIGQEEDKSTWERFGSLNEGVVEKLAREIVLRYLEETDWSKEEVGVFKKNLENNPEKLGYPKEVNLVEKIISRLSEITGREEQEIWETFIGSLFQGERFESEEIKNLFTKAFGPEFLDDLAKIPPAGFTGPMEEFMKKYQL